MASGPEKNRRRWPSFRALRWRGLPIRVMLLLSIALLPIGFVAVWQTRTLTEAVETRSALSLVALTEIAASGEEQLLERAIGAAMLLDDTLPTDGLVQASCRILVTGRHNRPLHFGILGVSNTDGALTCAASPTVADTAGDVALAASTDPTQLYSTAQSDDPRDGRATLAVPRMNGGHIIVSLSHDALGAQSDERLVAPPLSLTIYNARGEVLNIIGEPPSLDAALPEDPGLMVPVDGLPQVTQGATLLGTERTFVTTTLVPGEIYALAVWPNDSAAMARTSLSTLPVLMWIASLAVAYFAVHRLVVHPVRRLAGQMRRFAATRRLPSETRNTNLPQELIDLEDTFAIVASNLIGDEAQMEDTLRERNMLLKEIHHRVKNNLQMISSIMNMQIRNTTSEDTRNVVRGLQDRILGLAQVHQHLYESRDLSRADVAGLMQAIIDDLVQNMTDAGTRPEISVRLGKVELQPDQTVPLGLLMSELMTNALRYLTKGVMAKPYLRVTMQMRADKRVELVCENSITDSAGPDSAVPGLGRQLISAFTRQLGGEHEVLRSGGMYKVIVVFSPSDALMAAQDY